MVLKKQYIKWFVVLISFLLIVSISGFYFVYNKPHRNIEKSKAAFKLNSSDLLNAFEEDLLESNKKYVDQIIEVTGTIQLVNLSKGNASILLLKEGDFFGINCSFSEERINELNNVSKGDLITVKGECKGYIDDVLLNQCILIKSDQ